MQLKITNVQDLGTALRAVRKSSHVRIDDLASFAGVSKQFMSDLEHGKETIRLGLVLKVLDEIGLHLTVDLPDEVVDRWQRLRQSQAKPQQKD